MPYNLITISREYGAGARALAVAGRLGLSRDSLTQWDEHAPGFFESIGGAMMVGTPELSVDASVVSRPHARDVAAATRDYLVDAVALQPSIVVGHGAEAIFSERPRTLRIRLVAPIAVRSRRIAERRGCTQREATAMAHHFDQDRGHYVRAFHGRDVTDPLLYTLQINTGDIVIPEVVTIVRAVLDRHAG